MFDVVALGELLIDFTPAGNAQSGNLIFERNPGGAPANVLAAISKLGGSGAFIGKVGDDQFGHFLKGVLDENQIHTKGIRFSKEANTTLAFVHLDSQGDRSFSFYRSPGADTTLQEDELDLKTIDQSKIFHFGSLSMTNEPAKTATIKAVEYAKRSKKIISYDPNWRPLLWKSNEEAKKGMTLGLTYADVLKISEEELAFLTGEADLDRGSSILSDMGVKLVLITLGAKGSFYRCNGIVGHMSTYQTNVIDTTGAGDAFMGGLLYQISRLDKPLNALDIQDLKGLTMFSNAVGAVCASKRGAIPAMPSMEEVEICMNNTPMNK